MLIIYILHLFILVSNSKTSIICDKNSNCLYDYIINKTNHRLIPLIFENAQKLNVEQNIEFPPMPQYNNNKLCKNLQFGKLYKELQNQNDYKSKQTLVFNSRSAEEMTLLFYNQKFPNGPHYRFDANSIALKRCNDAKSKCTTLEPIVTQKKNESRYNCMANVKLAWNYTQQELKFTFQMNTTHKTYAINERIIEPKAIYEYDASKAHLQTNIQEITYQKSTGYFTDSNTFDLKANETVLLFLYLSANGAVRVSLTSKEGRIATVERNGLGWQEVLLPDGAHEALKHCRVVVETNGGWWAISHTRWVDGAFKNDYGVYVLTQDERRQSETPNTTKRFLQHDEDTKCEKVVTLRDKVVDLSFMNYCKVRKEYGDNWRLCDENTCRKVRKSVKHIGSKIFNVTVCTINNAMGLVMISWSADNIKQENNEEAQHYSFNINLFVGDIPICDNVKNVKYNETKGESNFKIVIKCKYFENISISSIYHNAIKIKIKNGSKTPTEKLNGNEYITCNEATVTK